MFIIVIHPKLQLLFLYSNNTHLPTSVRLHNPFINIMIKHTLNVLIYHRYSSKGNISCSNRSLSTKCIDSRLENLLSEYAYEGNLLILLFFNKETIFHIWRKHKVYSALWVKYSAVRNMKVLKMLFKLWYQNICITVLKGAWIG